MSNPSLPSRWARLLVAAPVLGLVVAGCSPRRTAYTPPDLAPPDTFSVPVEAGLVTEVSDLSEWWKHLGDPVLDELITEALAQNLDIEVAVAALREARGLRGGATQAMVPTVDARGSYTRTRNSEETPIGGFLPRYTDNYEVAADVSWELDLWGRIEQGVQAADARVGMRVEDTRAVVVLVMAETATNYVALRRAQERLEIARANATTQAETLRLTQSRLDVGLVSELDVAQASSLLAETQAAVPAFELEARKVRNRLAVLLGKHPGALEARLAEPQGIPSPPERVAMGIPADILRRRPDLRGAERALAAATADLGGARADLYPRFTLGGFLGVAAQHLPSMFTHGATALGLGPAVRWRIFNRRALRGQVRARGAQVDAALARYEKATLLALEEAENAMLGFAQNQARHRSLKEAVEHARRAQEIAQDRYRKGLTSFQSVLDSQRRLFALEDNEAVSRAAIARELIAVYKALGGGWESRDVVLTPAQSVPSKENS